jgi:hypothetical protein
MLVDANMADLHGPANGKVTLPLWIYCSFGDDLSEWNLDNSVDRRIIWIPRPNARR